MRKLPLRFRDSSSPFPPSSCSSSASRWASRLLALHASPSGATSSALDRECLCHREYGPRGRRPLSTSARRKQPGGSHDHPDAQAEAETKAEETKAATAATPVPLQRCGAPALQALPNYPFYFETGVGLFAKRTPRPFPPPFHSPPSGSFSDALSTHDRSRDRRRDGSGGGDSSMVDGRLISGCTNGDDAVFAGPHFIAANDGVGAWSMRPRGHAGLWARLVVHFWASAVHEGLAAVHPPGGGGELDVVQYLQQAYEQTVNATRAPNDWQGTTTATGALLSYRGGDTTATRGSATPPPSSKSEPLLYVTNLGDSQVMVVRPTESRLVFKSTAQWHWFDCPRQLGTNSPDTPRDDAVVDVVPIRVGDVVLAMSDGVIDNLWAHEIVDRVSRSVAAWQGKDKTPADLYRGMMTEVAEELAEAARVVAVDPFAESPFMEHAVDEGLPSEGGKLDDISVVAAVCRRARSP